MDVFPNTCMSGINDTLSETDERRGVYQEVHRLRLAFVAAKVSLIQL